MVSFIVHFIKSIEDRKHSGQLDFSGLRFLFLMKRLDIIIYSIQNI